MSNRTLIEINHDMAGEITRNPLAFHQAIIDYLRCGFHEQAEKLRPFGLRVIGMRHHSESYNIQWGYAKASEPSSGDSDTRPHAPKRP